MEREVIYSIQQAIDYIEDNLKNDISNRQIAVTPNFIFCGCFANM